MPHVDCPLSILAPRGDPDPSGLPLWLTAVSEITFSTTADPAARVHSAVQEQRFCPAVPISGACTAQTALAQAARNRPIFYACKKFDLGVSGLAEALLSSFKVLLELLELLSSKLRTIYCVLLTSCWDLSF